METGARPHLDCQILTPEGSVYTGRVRSVVAPGADGYFGVLPRHAPLVAALGRGELRIEDLDGTKKRWQVSGGFLEVLHNHVAVLAEKLEAIATRGPLIPGMHDVR